MLTSKRQLTTLTSRCWLALTPTNAAIARGAPGEFGRTITVREIKAEVALHYLFNFNQRRFRDEVEHGVAVARAWCDKNLK